MLKDKISDHVGRIHSQDMVPPLPATTTTALCKPVMVDTDLVELDPKKQQQEELGPSLSQLQQADSALVFLCHRGFNHITDKLQSGKLTIPRLWLWRKIIISCLSFEIGTSIMAFSNNCTNQGLTPLSCFCQTKYTLSKLKLIILLYQIINKLINKNDKNMYDRCSNN